MIIRPAMTVSVHELTAAKWTLGPAAKHFHAYKTQIRTVVIYAIAIAIDPPVRSVLIIGPDGADVINDGRADTIYTAAEKSIRALAN